MSGKMTGHGPDKVTETERDTSVQSSNFSGGRRNGISETPEGPGST